MAEPLDLSKLRLDYAQRSLSESDVEPDPVHQFTVWFNQVLNVQAHEPNAMTLATATRDGKPSARIVLLKHVDHQGFTFFTNYDSHKGKELADNPRVALVFYWPELERQVRIEGRVERTSEGESDQYFAARPFESRIGAAASQQSAVIPARSILEIKFKELTQEYADGNVPRPRNWGGYRVIPNRFEFWQGRPSRLHDRIEYVLEGEKWNIRRLAP